MAGIARLRWLQILRIKRRVSGQARAQWARLGKSNDGDAIVLIGAQQGEITVIQARGEANMASTAATKYRTVPVTELVS